MMIIDERAEAKLIQVLEALPLDPQNEACVYLYRADLPALVGMTDVILESAQRYFAAQNPQIYLCGNGDLYLLAPTFPAQGIHDFTVAMATLAGIPADEQWIGVHEVERDFRKMLGRLEKTLQKQRLALEAKQQQEKRQEQMRKRQAILDGALHLPPTNIQQTRSRRDTPQLMIIEDDPFSRRLVENALQKKYPLTMVGELADALETYVKTAPDLLFLDINLPDVDGHELLQKILEIDPRAHVIMLSGNADQQNIVQAMQKGAKGFVAKPFTKEKLFQYIDRCIQQTSSKYQNV